ncbi:MAG TPA: HD domain-containing protein [Gemmatimonadales bacterium]|nr:HD domain-containing protein [Gemmatimonadales bacterium]
MNGSPQRTDHAGLLAFIRAAERLKDTQRSGWTSSGLRDTVAGHTWRLCLMAVVLHPSFPEADLARLLKICILHDLGEAIGGDIPAPEQALRGSKSAAERADLIQLLAPLPDSLRTDFLTVWDEYEAASTLEARLAKALDKLETIIQHNQGANPAGFDYAFNLGYGREYTAAHPVLAEIRAELDAETARRAEEARRGG